ncbi:3' exoribonuclease family, domain 1-domain-containing protein [Globomyces pollinis-pini]|nr:3' exoribonuclease family, domain 1-domain-containing protein [Globomyces pollinis-pini]
MVVDRYRIYGPDATIVLPKPKKNVTLKNRKNNRTQNEIRPVFVNTGTIKQANGSCYFEANALKVICSVYGPRESTQRTQSSTKGILSCDFKFAPFATVKRRGYAKDDQERDFSLILEQALTPAIQVELFPKSRVDVYVLVLESDGCNASLAAAITCASMALANAGIAMFDLVTGCSAGFLNGMTGLDLDEDEESVIDGAVVLATMPSLNQVTLILQTGESSVDDTSKAIELCVDSCSQIKEILIKSINN